MFNHKLADHIRLAVRSLCQSRCITQSDVAGNVHTSQTHPMACRTLLCSGHACGGIIWPGNPLQRGQEIKWTADKGCVGGGQDSGRPGGMCSGCAHCAAACAAVPCGPPPCHHADPALVGPAAPGLNPICLSHSAAGRDECSLSAISCNMMRSVAYI